MIIYKCDKCDKSFNHKNDYIKHKNRKIKFIWRIIGANNFLTSRIYINIIIGYI